MGGALVAVGVRSVGERCIQTPIYIVSLGIFRLACGSCGAVRQSTVSRIGLLAQLEHERWVHTMHQEVLPRMSSGRSFFVEVL